MKYFYAGVFLLWTAMLGYLMSRGPSKPTAEMTVRLNTLTPIVMSGVLTITDTTGRQHKVGVEAGDLFIIRSDPDDKD